MQAEEHNIVKKNGAMPGGHYDYIITGGGCAGLSLLVHIIRSQRLRDKKILLVDKSSKTENDRTWCFWEQGDGVFQECVYHQWSHLHFHAAKFSKELTIDPYQYKVIRGLDFYNYCRSVIAVQSNIEVVQGNVEGVESAHEGSIVTIDGKSFVSRYVFNSILFSPPVLSVHHYWLLQHFRGWFIKTTGPQFSPRSATLMDFRTDQSHGATFFYVLPFSSTDALVEYTLFSPALLEDRAYEAALRTYVEEIMGIKVYTIAEKEKGSIPMTNYRFPAGRGNIINIGTAGGQTKGSSGYTFQFIQKHSAAIVAALEQEEHPLRARSQNFRFEFYDSVLLRILANKTLQGADIFSDLFKKNKPQQVLKFLDNETSLKEDIGLISSLPTIPFAKAAVSHLLQ